MVLLCLIHLLIEFSLSLEVLLIRQDLKLPAAFARKFGKKQSFVEFECLRGTVDLK